MSPRVGDATHAYWQVGHSPSRLMGQTGWDGLIPDKFDGIPRETHNTNNYGSSQQLLPILFQTIDHAKKPLVRDTVTPFSWQGTTCIADYMQLTVFLLLEHSPKSCFWHAVPQGLELRWAGSWALDWRKWWNWIYGWMRLSQSSMLILLSF